MFLLEKIADRSVLLSVQAFVLVIRFKFNLLQSPRANNLCKGGIRWDSQVFKRVVRPYFEVRWKVLSLARRTVGQTLKPDLLKPIS